MKLRRIPVPPIGQRQTVQGKPLPGVSRAPTINPVSVNKQSPAAPPVYRPQSPKVLQRKIAAGKQSPQLPKIGPVAPPVYRPVQKRIVQPKVAVASPARVVSNRKAGSIQMMEEERRISYSMIGTVSSNSSEID